jgi:drug/metabolite transporter (DMT)-like permease
VTLSTTRSLVPARDRINVAIRDYVVLVCAASAGVHAALVPEHLRESRALGLAFALSAGFLALAALVLRQPHHDSWAPRTAGILLGLAALTYAMSRTTGIPRLIPHLNTSTPSALPPPPRRWLPRLQQPC